MVVNPSIRVVNETALLRQQSAISYVRLKGHNVVIEDKPISCIWSLNTTLITEIVTTHAQVISTQECSDGAVSEIDCLVPSEKIGYGGQRPMVSL